jgi:hypothetical protein
MQVAGPSLAEGRANLLHHADSPVFTIFWAVHRFNVNGFRIELNVGRDSNSAAPPGAEPLGTPFLKRFPVMSVHCVNLDHSVIQYDREAL